MKSIHFRLLANIALLLCLLAWVYGGARLGFYGTFRTVAFTDPITEQVGYRTVQGFLPGIETLALGIICFAVFQFLGNLLEARADRLTR